MRSAIEAPSVDGVSHALSPPEEFPLRFQRHVIAGAAVFRPGEQRRLYRVERGAICHYAQSAAGAYEVIELAFPGDIIGLGCLPTHVSTAKAMVDTSVSVITDADLERALANDNLLYFRLVEAKEREFDYSRSRSRNADPLSPIQRVANLLLAISSINASEGREPLIVADDVSSGFVAEQLQMSIDALAAALLSLRRSGVVTVSDHGLRILDVAALETLAASA
jgi:CRP/FNR family transcriptional regulator, anaerobic regulatory protein